MSSIQHCGHCHKAEPVDELLTMAEFLPKDDYLPALQVVLHKSHFGEEGISETGLMRDGAEFKTKHGRYVLN